MDKTLSATQPVSTIRRFWLILGLIVLLDISWAYLTHWIFGLRAALVRQWIFEFFGPATYEHNQATYRAIEASIHIGTWLIVAINISPFLYSWKTVVLPALSNRSRSRDFLVGFIGWYLVFSIYWGIFLYLGSSFLRGDAGIVLLFCFYPPLLLNLIGISSLIIRPHSPWVMVGVISALVFNLIAWLFLDVKHTFFSFTMSFPFFIPGLARWFLPWQEIIGLFG